MSLPELENAENASVQNVESCKPEVEEDGFSTLGLPDFIIKAITTIGYKIPSPIQKATIPTLLEGNDVIGMAQTGTGKTAAFALPILAKVDVKSKDPQALIMCPTRELALQVAEAFESFAAHMKGLKVLAVFGGQDMRVQLRALSGGVHIIVGTPGRLLDHLQRKSLKLSSIKNLVLDEADEMLRMGFIDDVETILSSLPDERQVALFSATMPRPIRRVAEQYLTKPVEVSIKPAATTGATIDQCYWLVSGTNKLDALTRLLEVEDYDGVIIFVRTKTNTVELSDKLTQRGFSAAALNGDMNQQLRQRTVDQLKKSQLDILIATDVAARGLDVERISHVLNFDIPFDAEAYVHRIGRTGRAGRKGKAILFVAPRERRMLKNIERTTRQNIKQIELPTRKELVERRCGKFTQTITDTLDSESNLEFFQGLMQTYCDEKQCSPLEAASALAYLLQKNRPLQPKPVYESRSEPSRSHRSNEGRQRSSSRDRRGNDNRVGRDRYKETASRGPRGSDIPMERFKIAVGRADNVTPREIVGAIANEANIKGNHIGHIKIFDRFTTVDLPEGLSKEVFSILKKTRVCSRPLNIEPFLDKPPSCSGSGRGDFERSSQKEERARTVKPKRRTPVY